MLASEVLCHILLQGLVASGEQNKAKTEKNSAQQECTNGHSGRTKWSFHLTNGHFRLSAKFGCGHTVWAYFPHFASISHPCPCSNRFRTNGTYSGRTGRGPLARRARVKCECEDGKLCLQVFLSLFGLTPSYFPFSTPLPNTHTDFG